MQEAERRLRATEDTEIPETADQIVAAEDRLKRIEARLMQLEPPGGED